MPETTRRHHRLKGVRPLLLLFALSTAGFGQLISVGVRGGVPVTNFLDAVNGRDWSVDSTGDQFIVGPTVALNLPLGLSIQADALYRRVGYEYTRIGNNTFATAKTNAWQFPIMGKWAFLPGPIKPFVEGGVAFQKISDWTLIGDAFRDSGALTNNPTVGATFGVGIQLKLGRVRIEPEARYTRWGVDAVNNPIDTIAKINRHQGDFLVGITF